MSPGERPGSAALDRFAAQVGPAGPVAVEGGRTHWELGGGVRPGTRLLAAPAGVVDHQPDEMIVRVRAGTPVAELDATLATRGQMVPLDPPRPDRATVGGVLAAGRSGPRRLRWGPLRDLVLEARYVSDRGELVRTGGPVVKNVTGFDLCRLLVGSLGTLGLIGEVVLRTQPLPPAWRWWRCDCPPGEVLDRLYRPSSVLWDGTTTWVLLEGQPAEVGAEGRRLGGDFVETGGGPDLDRPGRLSLRPSALHTLPAGHRPGSFVAEVGVGVVHLDAPAPPAPPLPPEAASLHRRIKAAFDPAGRLNPGRSVT